MKNDAGDKGSTNSNRQPGTLLRVTYLMHRRAAHRKKERELYTLATRCESHVKHIQVGVRPWVCQERYADFVTGRSYPSTISQNSNILHSSNAFLFSIDWKAKHSKYFDLCDIFNHANNSCFSWGKNEESMGGKMFDKIGMNGHSRAFQGGQKTPALPESINFLKARGAPIARNT